MGKQKSSATSATRKKHARKAAASNATDEVDNSPQPSAKGGKGASGKGKGKKKGEPRIKMYIPPVKPPALQRDPVEVYGLASQLPPDLLVIFRKLTKKDIVTRTRALEELQSKWIDSCSPENKSISADDRDTAVAGLEVALPAWNLHFPALMFHPSRRIRLLTAQIQAACLQVQSLHDQILDYLSNAPELYCGAWKLSCFDIDRQVSQLSQQTWSQVSLAPLPEGEEEGTIESRVGPYLVSFTVDSVMAPESVYGQFYPGAVTKTSGPNVSADQSRIVEGEDESPNDRAGRIRLAALGSLRSLIASGLVKLSHGDESEEQRVESILNDPQFWTILYSGDHPPFVSSPSPEFTPYGMDQPGVRRAGWGLVQVLAKHHHDHLGSALPVMSAAILRSIWVEPDAGTRHSALDGLLSFLAGFPQAWKLVTAFGVESESDELEDEIDHTVYSSPAYIEFLQFLRMACGGSPTHFYPSIIIILSKLSTDSLYRTQPTIDELFDALWAAVDSQALTIVERGSAPVLAFISAVLENARFISTKLRQPSSGEVDDPALELSSKLVVDQIGQVWNYYMSHKLVAPASEFGTILCKTLDRLAGNDIELFKLVWTRIEDATILLLEGENIIVATKVAFTDIWKAMDAEAKQPEVKEQLHAMLGQMLHISLQRLESASSSPLYLEHVILMLTDMRHLLVGFQGNQESLQSLLETGFIRLDGKLDPGHLSRLIEAILFYFQDDQISKQKYWHGVLTVLADPSSGHKSTLGALLDASKRGRLSGLSSATVELHTLVLSILSDTKEGSGDDDQLLLDLIRHHDIFLSEKELNVCANFVCSWLEEVSAGVLRQPGYSVPSSVSFAVQVLRLLHDVRPETVVSRRVAFAGPLFVLKYILPRIFSETDSFVGNSVYSTLIGGGEGFQVWLPELQGWLLDPQVEVDIDILVDALLEASHQDSEWLLHKVIPSKTVLDALFMEEVLIGPSPILATMDALVTEKDEGESPSKEAYDGKQPSSYARMVWALSSLMAVDRHLARSSYWVLKHLLLIQQLAEDRLALPMDSIHDTFGSETSRTTIRFILNQSRKTISYLLSASSEDDFPHSQLVEIISGKKPPRETNILSDSESLQAFTVDVCHLAQKKDYVRMARLVRTLLVPLLRGASGVDVDAWLTLGRTAKRSAPNFARGVVAAAVSTGVETPLLARMRNEAASDLIGLPVSRANTEGSNHLHTLLVLAPPLDSDSVLLPTQRSINLVQTVEKWINTESDDDEEVGPVIESQMMALFLHIAPVLQSLSGRHWEFAFDLIENTLEGASFKDTEMFVQLARTLELVANVQTLVATNKQLRASWATRQQTISRLVRDLVVSSSAHKLDGGLELVYRTKALNILHESAEAILEPGDFSKFVYLLHEPHLETQQEGYGLVRTAALKYTEHVVMEVGLNSTAPSSASVSASAPEGAEARLPTELIQLLDAYGILDLDDEGWEEEDTEEDVGDWSGLHQRQFGFFLGWMALFDIMENTSLRVRAGYVEDIRNGELVSRHLMPNLCRMLRLGQPGKKPVRMDLYEVDSFYVQLFEPTSMTVLGAHVYYRALRAIPSLVRVWWTECKDRQLSNAIATYTASYFSPVLVSAELASLRPPFQSEQQATAGQPQVSGRELLEDEATSVRVSGVGGQAGSWEVSMSYVIDEQKMEMGVKLPSEYPLRNVEVKDGRRVGVPETKWRGWLFAVQQLVGTQNGHVVDALGMFKKNVSLHFEGQVECAICYSIISLTDLQLPTKPCKTCKNRFHASCLYKWFKSSSSSSCPLCRSDIF
ncbi:hypothetical protein FRB91_005987 [Serendipita sp. 411]|nr:hypothetical protein FRB91_005987 [Serendipita sp. 411]